MGVVADEPDSVSQVSVCQVSDLPKASFRFHLAIDTLAVGWTLAAIRQRWGLTPIRLCPCRANKETKVGQKTFVSQPTRFAMSR